MTGTLRAEQREGVVTTRIRSGALMVCALGLAACGSGGSDARAGDGASRTSAVTALSDTVRPSDPSAAEVLAGLGLSDIPGIPARAARQVKREHETQRWYRPGPHGHMAAGHVHDDAAAQRALDELTPGRRATLDRQLARARRAALRYPTFGAAHAAGFRAVGPPTPGLGVHAAQLRHQADADFHFDWPGVLMYRDTQPDAPVVGILYLTRAKEAPEGFVGDVDQWHEHIKVCIRGQGEEIEILSVDDGEYAKRNCGRQGGVFFGESGYMLHVWPIEGWVPPEGPFSDDNSLVQPSV
jgi:hypothetical protein